MNKASQLSVCVYAGSSDKVNPRYIEAARTLGRLCARMGVSVVCGGGATGLMAALIDGCTQEGGQAIGVLPGFMIERKWHHRLMSRLIETPDMHTRKSRMMRGTSFAIALPGGIGTFDELCEIITWRQLGIYQGEVLLVNVDGYYEPFLTLLDHAAEEGFMRHTEHRLFTVVGSAGEAADIISTRLQSCP